MNVTSHSTSGIHTRGYGFEISRGGRQKEPGGPQLLRASSGGASWSLSEQHELEPRHKQSGNSSRELSLIIGGSLVRGLNEIFVSGQTTVLCFGGAFVAKPLKLCSKARIS